MTTKLYALLSAGYRELSSVAPSSMTFVKILGPKTKIIDVEIRYEKLSHKHNKFHSADILNITLPYP